MTPFDLITLALFAWYVSFVLIRTEGPFKIFLRVRNVTTLGGLLQCIVCLVIWASGLGYVLIQIGLEPIVHIGAIAGLALWGHKYTGWDYSQ